MKRLVLTTILATMIAAATPVLAKETTKVSDVPSNVTTQEVKEADQIAVQGLNAMHDIQFARLALFQGLPDRAEALTKNALTLLTDDSVQWLKFVRSSSKVAHMNDKYVAIDASIGISEDYVATPEKQEAVKRANKKMEKGDKKGALEELRLAGVGVVENVYLMPLEKTRNTVTEAQKLMAEHKYYEANLALKGAEDGIVMDSNTAYAK